MKTYLARQVEVAVERLEVLQRVTRNELLVEPDLVVGAGVREQVFRDLLGELVDLSVKLGLRGNERASDVPGGLISK